jgi:hypothetical protein
MYTGVVLSLLNLPASLLTCAVSAASSYSGFLSSAFARRALKMFGYFEGRSLFSSARRLSTSYGKRPASVPTPLM